MTTVNRHRPGGQWVSLWLAPKLFPKASQISSYYHNARAGSGPRQRHRESWRNLEKLPTQFPHPHQLDSLWYHDSLPFLPPEGVEETLPVSTYINKGNHQFTLRKVSSLFPVLVSPHLQCFVSVSNSSSSKECCRVNLYRAFQHVLYMFWFLVLTITLFGRYSYFHFRGRKLSLRLSEVPKFHSEWQNEHL